MIVQWIYLNKKQLCGVLILGTFYLLCVISSKMCISFKLPDLLELQNNLVSPLE